MLGCLLLRNAHKITRQAVLNVCTESEPFCVHFSKVNKLPYDITTLVCILVDPKDAYFTTDYRVTRKCRKGKIGLCFEVIKQIAETLS